MLKPCYEIFRYFTFMNDRKKYLLETVPQLLSTLSNEHEPKFGIMSAQHMVEHLIWVTKSSVKNYGPAPEELTTGQQRFMKFIDNGAKFEHRPKDQKREDLDPPRMADISAAIDEIPNAIARLYQHTEDHVFFNPMMGKLTFEQMEIMHASHFKWHLEEQFNLSV